MPNKVKKFLDPNPDKNLLFVQLYNEKNSRLCSLILMSTPVGNARIKKNLVSYPKAFTVQKFRT